MNRIRILVSVLIAFAILSGCSSPATSAAGDQPTAGAAKPFKVGLLTTGPVNDKGYNQQGYEGLQRIKNELGAEISNVELEDNPSLYEKAIRDYASQGYDLIMAHGKQFQDAANTVAPDFPDTIISVTSSSVAKDNVIGVALDIPQSFYVLGVIAGSMADKVGMIGGQEIPSIQGSFTGFMNGARSVNPDVEFSVVYLGGFTDVAGAKEAALSMVASQGVEFLLPNANIASQGVYQACAEANVLCIGVFGNQTDFAPKNIVVNYASDFGVALNILAKQVKDGTVVRGKPIVLGLEAQGVAAYLYNENANVPVPESARKAVDEAKQKLINKEVDPSAPVTP
ncbi:MAG: BMP family protein [Anaerolineaceae bacterium]|nr:BMP family protein [Anaerolineaceae bacterium]